MRGVPLLALQELQELQALLKLQMPGSEGTLNNDHSAWRQLRAVVSYRRVRIDAPGGVNPVNSL